MKIKTDDAYIDSTNRKKLELDWENRIFNTRGYALRECEREVGGGGEREDGENTSSRFLSKNCIS